MKCGNISKATTRREALQRIGGGFGMLGCFTKITLQMKKVYSGKLKVEAFAAKDLAELFAQFGNLRNCTLEPGLVARHPAFIPDQFAQFSME